jgi:hypothetical protein
VKRDKSPTKTLIIKNQPEMTGLLETKTRSGYKWSGGEIHRNVETYNTRIPLLTPEMGDQLFSIGTGE